MNILSIISFVLAIAVLYGGLALSSNDLKIFYDVPSLFIVIGGTFAATAISFQLNRLASLLKIFIRRFIFGKKFEYRKIISELLNHNESFRKGESFDGLSSKTKDLFLKEGLLLAKDGVLAIDDVIRLLTERNDNMYQMHLEDANKIKVISKYPPAFGMIGTTIGMIVLLGNLAAENAMKLIGPAMGICLITTLYGGVFSNLLLIPLSENLLDDSKEVFTKNQIIIKGLELITQKTNPILMCEELNSYLSPKDRLDWKKVTR